MVASTIRSLRSLQTSLNTAIESYVDILQDTGQADPAVKTNAKKSAFDAAAQLSNALRDPFGEFVALGLQPTQNLVIRIAIDLDLFSRINERESLESLARDTKADQMLLLRILRLLVATQIISEPEPLHYSSTPTSRMLRIPSLRDWMKTTYDTLYPIWLQTPIWLAKNGYPDIANLSSNPTLSMYGSNFFEQLAADPRREADFASAMKIQELSPPFARPQFPFSEAVRDFDAEVKAGGSDVVFIDVGGGHGQFLESVIKEHPGLPGRKILQDIPTVIADLEQKKLPFEAVAHDFFKPQPIKGAKFYHLRGILHDWPDDSCIQILSQLHGAFKPDYSRLLIQTYILPETGCGVREAMMDINMWTSCGLERTPSQWRELLQKGGFEILRTVRAQVGPFGIIEARAREIKASKTAQKL